MIDTKNGLESRFPSAGQAVQQQGRPLWGRVSYCDSNSVNARFMLARCRLS